MMKKTNSTVVNSICNCNFLILGRPVFTANDIEVVCKRLPCIKDDSDLQDIVPDRKVRREVLGLVYDFFRDISGEFSDLTLKFMTTLLDFHVLITSSMNSFV